jgi:hypothetical protein
MADLGTVGQNAAEHHIDVTHSSTNRGTIGTNAAEHHIDVTHVAQDRGSVGYASQHGSTIP